MTAPLPGLVDAIARRTGVHLAPGWEISLPPDIDPLDPSAVEEMCVSLGWPPPEALRSKPGANAFPLLLHTPETGWCLAEQWQNQEEIRVLTGSGIAAVAWADAPRLAKIRFPTRAGSQGHANALSVFRAAFASRRRMIAEAGMATVVINLLALGTSIFSMQVYDRVIPSGGFATLWVMTAGMILVLLFEFLIRNSRAIMVDHEAANIDAETSEFFFARMQAIRLDNRPDGIGTIAAQMRGLDQVRSIMAAGSLFLLADLPFALLFIIIMALIGGSVALVPLILFPMSIVLAIVFSRLIREDAARAQVTGNRKNGLLVETLDSAETLKANFGSWHMLAQWNTLVEKVDESEQKVRKWSTFATSSLALLQQLAYVGIIGAGAYKVSLGEMTMGGLIACTIISGRINGPLVGSLPNLLIQWGYVRSSLASLNSLLDLPSDHRVDHQPVRLLKIDGRLQLDNVEFNYPGSRSGISVPRLSIAEGERIGIIGPVGSGKSTLLRLLAGLYTPHRGHVLLDGIDLRQIAEDDVRRDICYFPQDYRVISGTLRENLSLGLPAPRDDVILEAATRTGLIGLINKHPKGLDLLISEGGRDLSGGQRALVGLTRALLASPRLLLLDEPTANLDQESEAQVLKALIENLGSNCGVILVTHKPQLLSAVQRLLVVVEGRITIDGPTSAVIAELKKRAASGRPNRQEV